MKENKGITLVALVITIIVLLIVAVIAIRQVTNRDIVTEAQSASQKYVLAQENEELDLQETVNYIRETKNQIQSENDGGTIDIGFGPRLITFRIDDWQFTTSSGTTWEQFATTNSNFRVNGNYIDRIGTGAGSGTVKHANTGEPVRKTEVIGSNGTTFYCDGSTSSNI